MPGQQRDLACGEQGGVPGRPGAGQFYADFTQVADDEVVACPDRAATLPSPAQASTAPGADPSAVGEESEPSAGLVRLAGYLTVPGEGTWDRGIRPRQRQQPAQPPQPVRRQHPERSWPATQPHATAAAVGYFGASTGAAAALWAAAEPGSGIVAVVSRGGRPDLALPGYRPYSGSATTSELKPEIDPGEDPLRLVDRDVLEVENLVRHPLGAPALGLPKAPALAARICREFPPCHATGLHADFLELAGS
jgi:hypothetical protein